MIGCRMYEIERRFLVKSSEWRRHSIRQVRLRQAYLAVGGNAVVRVRVIDETSATLTVKSEAGHVRRHEFEYPIPVGDAEALLSLRTGALISKVRHQVPYRGHLWELDVFDGMNIGLVIAEVELALASEDVALPGWIGREITGDARFSNSRLAIAPYFPVATPTADARVTAELASPPVP